jgi:hypothetical protein
MPNRFIGQVPSRTAGVTSWMQQALGMWQQTQQEDQLAKTLGPQLAARPQAERAAVLGEIATKNPRLAQKLGTILQTAGPTTEDTLAQDETAYLSNALKSGNWQNDPVAMSIFVRRMSGGAAPEQLVGSRVGMEALGGEYPQSQRIAANLVEAPEEIARRETQAATQQRGQDISATTQRRGQDVSATTQRRGQDLREAIARAQEAKKPLAAETGPSAYRSERVDRILQSVDQLAKRVDATTVGLGSLTGAVPGTPARNFRADLDTLKANIAFGELQAMREASKTGGALGQIAIRELELLESTLGALDQGQGPNNFKKNLQKIKASLSRWDQAVSSGGGSSDEVISDANTLRKVLGLK